MTRSADDASPVPLWHGGAILPPNSHFSQEVFKTIRPGVPDQAWPVGQPVVGLFLPIPSGLALMAEFENLHGGYKKQAEQMVLAKGLSLVRSSPAAAAANAVFKSKRWRDIFMYSLLPLVFAIPIVDGLFANADHLAMALSGLDFIAFAASQLRLMQARQTLVESRFIAHIPTPSMKIRLNINESAQT